MNVLVIVLDTVRPDSLGVNGHPVCRTPVMDALARDGAIFTNAYAEFPVTVPTRTALVSGSYTFTNRPWMPLRPYDLHVAELFRDADYRTVAFSDTPFQARYGFDRGFDQFHEYPTKLQPPLEEIGPVDLRGAAFPPGPGGDLDRRLWKMCVEGFLNYYPQKLGKVGIELLVDEASSWIERNAGKEPFFLWLDTFQPHEPWVPPAPYDASYQPENYSGRYLPMPSGPHTDWMTAEELEHVKALYMGEVTYTDEHLGRLLGQLDHLGLADDTLVILLSDHGQPFGDHGTIRKFGVPVYDELAKVVFIARKPGLVPAGLRIDGFAQTCDVLPTLVDLCDLPAPQPQRVWVDLFGGAAPTGVDGVSLGPLLRGDSDSARDAVYMGAFGLRASIRVGDWKLIDNRGERSNELFDLASDPFERDNRLASEPDRAADLHRRLWEFCSRWSSTLAWRDEPARPAPSS